MIVMHKLTGIVVTSDLLVKISNNMRTSIVVFIQGFIELDAHYNCNYTFVHG